MIGSGLNLSYNRYKENNDLDAENAKHILNLARYFEGVWDIKVLTREAKLLLHAVRGEDMSIKEGIILTESSYRGFYILLDKMVARQLIEIVPDENDRRVKRIKIRHKAHSK